MASPTRFPDGFLWGAATSAYQIEGSPLADGAGPSIWHRWTHTPGRTLAGDTGDVACDHYRRSGADVDLMAGLGLNAYRFSIAWGRLLPEGRGKVNRKGLDFYSRLVDRLLANGIRPMATLYHWDLPAALDDRGGWLNPDIAEWFAEYASVAFRALGDRIPMWLTINEPWVVVHDGYVSGSNAPGHRNLFEAPRAAHNVLCAHGAAVEAYRASGRKGQIGLAVNLEPKDPASRRAEDLQAQRRADVYFNHQYLDPVFKGHYPAELPAIYGEGWPEPAARDLKRIRRPIDFLGINYYTRKVVRHDPTDWPLGAKGVRQPRALHMETGWEVHPPSLTRTLEWVAKSYGDIPLYITENGAAFPDPDVARNGVVKDPLRIHYYREHLLAAHTAIHRGVNLRGYFAWSLLDNLEWSTGYLLRMGLVHVNYATQRRTLKASAHYYKDVIRTNGALLAAPLPPLPRALVERARRAPGPRRVKAGTRPSRGTTAKRPRRPR